MHEPPFVWIQRAELLVHPGLLGLLGEKLRGFPKLDVLAFAILEGVDEDAFLIVERTAERHVDDVLQRLERFATMTNEQLGVFTREVQTGDVRRILESDGGCYAERAREPLEKFDNRAGRIVRRHKRHGCYGSRAAASSVFPPPARFTRRSAGGR